MTTTNGKVFVCLMPTKPDSDDFVKMVDRKLGPFMQESYRYQRMKTLLLDLQGGASEAMVQGLAINL